MHAFLLLFIASPNQPVLSVGPIAGDRRIALLVTETVKTDLARSPRVSLMESKVASYQVVGSCLEHHGRMIMNFRIIDSKTGLAMRGVAVSGEATPGKFLTSVEALTQKLTMKLAGNPSTAPVRPASIALYRPDATRKRPAQREPGLALSKVETPSDRRDTIGSHRLSNKGGEGGTGPARNQDAASSVPTNPPHEGDVSNPGADVLRPYTGVIIDARGLNLDRSMSPRIHREGGETVWSGGEAEPDFVVDEGIVVYARSIEDAKRLRRAGSNPLILRAIERYDDPFHADPVLANEDAATLMTAARKDGFLKKFNVVFVID